MRTYVTPTAGGDHGLLSGRVHDQYNAKNTRTERYGKISPLDRQTITDRLRQSPQGKIHQAMEDTTASIQD